MFVRKKKKDSPVSDFLKKKREEEVERVEKGIKEIENLEKKK